ncbi:Myb-like DNA-binding domain containing protein [Histomonas meleagridis]|uniref:Myb-like DNA-binding domain containing protein n=1 Tax=Histomonas meleagridis TaxID=135588 RepID=UPI00355A5EEE|nr:Myb-like DNA-binding domain containing protein [Histomonas meleagridis]KAH0801719.1 Myb-like DNA-binding domain containing protein [Histomonas meleagridis]
MTAANHAHLVNFCLEIILGGNKYPDQIINYISSCLTTIIQQQENTEAAINYINLLPMGSLALSRLNEILSCRNQPPLPVEGDIFKCNSQGRQVTRHWKYAEDNRLLCGIYLYGTQWSLIATFVGNGRDCSQCQQRWQRVLYPGIRNRVWTLNDDIKLAKLHSTYGNKWAQIAREIGNASDTQCRYRYNSLLTSLFRF